MKFMAGCVIFFALLYSRTSPDNFPSRWFTIIFIGGWCSYVVYVWILDQLIVRSQSDLTDSSWGLQQFYEKDEAHPGAGGVSIVFVHGLASHPEFTWLVKNGVKRRDWISSFLLPIVSAEMERSTGARLRAYYFNYESKWMALASQGRLRRYGERLELELQKILSEKGERVIMVGHSLGGLVIKQALTLPPSLRERALHSKKIAGIIFLGTPHHGSGFAFIGLLIALMCLPFDPNLGLITSVRTKSQTLRDLHENFITQRGGVPITNFYESDPVRLKFRFLPITSIYVVPEDSATFIHQGTRNFPMHGGHSDLNKLKEEGDNFKQFSGELLRILSMKRDQTVSQLSKGFSRVPMHDLGRSRQNRHYTSNFWKLFDDNMESSLIEKLFKEKAQARHPDTCHWILSRTPALKWLIDEKDSALIWISGNIGSGKTTLCTFIMEELLQPYQTKEIVVLLTSCVPELLRSERQIVCDLVQQLLARLPHLKETAFSSLQLAAQSNPQFLKWFDEMCSQPRSSQISTGQNTDLEFSCDITWHWAVLKILLMQASMHDAFVIVDGLDGLAESTLEKLMTGFREYLMADMQFKVKLVFTSRPSELVRARITRFKNFQRLETEATDHVAIDIEGYLKSELDRISAFRAWPLDKTNRVLENLKHASGDMFLYASFAVRRLEYCTRSGVEEVLKEGPDGLNRLYEQALNSIAPSIRARQSNILLCLLYARRKLTLADLQGVFAPEIPSSNIEARTGLISDLMLYSPLVQWNQSVDHVDFVHPSAKCYIENLANSPDLLYSPFLPTRQQGNAVLAAGCLRYMISKSNVHFPMYWNDNRYWRTRAIFHKYPGLHYAFSFWLSHCQAALCSEVHGSGALAVVRLLGTLDGLRRGGSGTTSFWSEVIACRPSIGESMQPEKILRSLTSTEFFALCGLPSVVEKLLQKDTSTSKACVVRNHNTVLALAIKGGCKHTLTILLTHYSIKSLDGLASYGVISDAAWSGNSDLLRKVIQLKSHEKIGMRGVAEAMYAGVATKNLAMVNALIDQDNGIDVLMDKDDRTHMTALHWLFAARQQRYLSAHELENLLNTAILLVRKGAMINAKDVLGNTILHYVSLCPSMGQWFFIKRLIDEGANPEESNTFGWLPVHLLARRCKSVCTIRYLDQQYPTMVFQRTAGHMTALHWATQRAGSGSDDNTGAVLLYLLTRGLSLAAADRRGTTPLQTLRADMALGQSLWEACEIPRFTWHGQPTLLIQSDLAYWDRDIDDGFALVNGHEEDIDEELDCISTAHLQSQRLLLQ